MIFAGVCYWGKVAWMDCRLDQRHWIWAGKCYFLGGAQENPGRIPSVIQSCVCTSAAWRDDMRAICHWSSWNLRGTSWILIICQRHNGDAIAIALTSYRSKTAEALSQILTWQHRDDEHDRRTLRHFQKIEGRKSECRGRIHSLNRNPSSNFNLFLIECTPSELFQLFSMVTPDSSARKSLSE